MRLPDWAQIKAASATIASISSSAFKGLDRKVALAVNDDCAVLGAFGFKAVWKGFFESDCFPLGIFQLQRCNRRYASSSGILTGR